MADTLDPISFGLPDDYDGLTRDGQRLARVALVQTQRTPEDMVRAWSFLRNYYLMSLPVGLWHKPPIYDSPRCHYDFIYDMAKYPRNAKILPRSFAKSTLCEEFLLTLCYGHAPFKALIIRASDGFVRTSFTRLMFQIDDNPRLIDDFGHIKPRKNQPGIWSKSCLWLTNGFQLDGRSVMGKLLGLRPQLVICDDAEFDTSMKISPALLQENFRRMWLHNVIPMLDEGCAAALVGTLFSRKLFIYRQATASVDEDPTLAYWNREVVAIVDPETGKPTWPAKFPPEKIAELRDSMPPAVFAAQYMNDPGTEEDRQFVIHDDYGYYTVENPDDEYQTSPLNSKSTLLCMAPHFKGGEAIPVRRPFGETVAKMFRIITVDPIRKPSSTSDFACALVTGIERSTHFKDVWWLLDIKIGRPDTSELLEWVWNLGQKWLPRIVAVEAIGLQKNIADHAIAMFSERPSPHDWRPRVLPLTYARTYSGDMGKASRISNLGWRFDHHKIKYPRHLMLHQAWAELRKQTIDFTSDLNLLPKDDAIDTLAMVSFVARPGGRVIGVDNAPPTHMELLARGEMNIPGTRVPILTSMNAEDITPDAQAGIDQARMKGHNRDESKRRRSRRPLHRRTHCVASV